MNKTKKLILMALLMLALILFTQGGVQANFQSSPNASPVSKYLKEWVYDSPNIKSMNSSTGAIGTTSGVNVHLQKNTEYGAMLILGVSDFGKQSNGTSGSDYFNQSTGTGIATTTGNASGVYQINSKYEFVAAGKPDSTKSYYFYYGISSRERDEYTTSITSESNKTNLPSSSMLKKGDAMDIYNWQGSTLHNWIYDDSSTASGNEQKYYYVFIRRGFGYDCKLTFNNYWKSDSSRNYGRDGAESYARACMVNAS